MAVATIIGDKEFIPRKGFKKCLIEVIRKIIIENNISIFLVNYGDYFTKYCLKIIKDLKKEFSFLKVIQIRDAEVFSVEVYNKFIAKYVDEIIRPKSLENLGLYEYYECHKYAIDNSICALFYYNKNCRLPIMAYWYGDKPEEKFSIRGVYSYAESQKKKIINVFDLNKI
ncbi:MAG: hypothetical protein J6C53_00615 [Clostridia bacterium]|nr:hypothetical protein [Clostridia bacterium]